VNCDDDIRLLRRVRRDVQERKRSAGGVLKSYTKFVKPSYDTYVHPVSFIFTLVNDLF
jgi:uridine kinase